MHFNKKYDISNLFFSEVSPVVLKCRHKSANELQMQRQYHIILFFINIFIAKILRVFFEKMSLTDTAIIKQDHLFL